MIDELIDSGRLLDRFFTKCWFYYKRQFARLIDSFLNCSTGFITANGSSFSFTDWLIDSLFNHKLREVLATI